MRSIHILSTSIHSSCEQYTLYTLVHTLLNAGLSCTPHSCSRPEDDQLLKHSTLPRPPFQPRILMFYQKKREKKLELSQRGAFSLFCVLESATIFRDDLFELTESEFLTIYSKAKSAAPYFEERGRSNSPQRD